MKNSYTKPSITFEEYELNTAIATGCDYKVNLGPGDEIHDICDSYGNTWDSLGDSVMAQPVVQNWYENSCSCYLSAGGATVFTS